MKDKTYAEYNKASNKFKQDFEKFISSLISKLQKLTTKVETFDGNTLTLKDNTVHIYNGRGLSSLTILYPSGSFTSTILFSTKSSGDIKVTFPSSTKFLGSAPYEFFPAENWELNIHDGRVIGAQIYDN